MPPRNKTSDTVPQPLSDALSDLEDVPDHFWLYLPADASHWDPYTPCLVAESEGDLEAEGGVEMRGPVPLAARAMGLVGVLKVGQARTVLETVRAQEPVPTQEVLVKALAHFYDTDCHLDLSPALPSYAEDWKEQFEALAEPYRKAVAAGDEKAIIDTGGALCAAFLTRFPSQAQLATGLEEWQRHFGPEGDLSPERCLEWHEMTIRWPDYWRAGFEGARKGELEDDNPFHPDRETIAHEAWQQGFKAGSTPVR